MKGPIAAVLSALILAASIVGAQFVNPYQIASNTQGVAWRLDRRTGEVKMCATKREEGTLVVPCW